MKFSNLKIGTRLAAGFLFVSSLIAVMVFIATRTFHESNKLTDRIIEEDFQKVTLAYEISEAANSNMRILLEMLVETDPAAIGRLEKEIEANRAQNAETIKKLQGLIRTDAVRKLMEKVLAQRAAFIKERNAAIQLLKDGEREGARVLYQAKVYPVAKEYQKGLDEFIETQKKRVAEASAEIDAVNDRAEWMMWGGLAVAMILAGFIAWFVTRSIVVPIRRAVSVSESVAKGDLGVSVNVESQDETGQLLQSMQGMVGTLKRFNDAQLTMAREHEAGFISKRIPVDQFSGAYGEMAASVNELVGAHIALKMRVVDVIKEYATGDLTVDMEELPGEKARITEAMREVKSSLQAVNGQIKSLVAAAVQGDFKARGDEARFQHEFREMVEGLNRLMDISDRGLSEVARMLKALSGGDLTDKITTDYDGTFAQLKDDSNETVAQLTRIVGQIREASESINTAAREIAAGNSDLSSRTEEQASSLEETAASMEELTGTVKQNAENAKQANQLAVSASEVATQGGQVVSQVVETMGSISESAKKIEDIISVIDGIAFQTNILALNAAVEAARAGEQGRGFAVVASEVRSLAQRSAGAAKEIKDLIGDSVDKVEAGSKLVNSAGETMDEVVKSVKRVADIISEITAASMEQSTGIEQVNQAIAQMDQVTQQNAALVEEAAAAAESMEEQARGLTQAVSVFKLAGGMEARTGSPKLAAVPTTRSKVAPQTKTQAKPQAKPATSSSPAKLASGGDWKDI